MEAKKTKLKEILKTRRMSQKELLDSIIIKFPKAKINYVIISKIVNGKQLNYELKTALRISKALSVKIDDIIEEERIDLN